MSKKSTHVNILGVDIPLATIAYCTSTVRPLMIDEWNDYCNFSELCYDNTLFKDIAEHRPGSLPVHTGVNRQFFTYKTLSDIAHDMMEASIE